MSYIDLLFRGAGWGCGMSLLGNVIFIVFVMAPMTYHAVSADFSNPYEAIGAWITGLLIAGLLSVIPSVVLGSVGGMVLNLLIQRNDSIRSSAPASASVGAIIGLVFTLLIVLAFLALLGLDYDTLDTFKLGGFALLIGAIVGGIAGWRLSSVRDI
jgi:hypothetical protein